MILLALSNGFSSSREKIPPAILELSPIRSGLVPSWVSDRTEVDAFLKVHGVLLLVTVEDIGRTPKPAAISGGGGCNEYFRPHR